LNLRIPHSFVVGTSGAGDSGNVPLENDKGRLQVVDKHRKRIWSS